jgi:hypothetical protein
MGEGIQRIGASEGARIALIGSLIGRPFRVKTVAEMN